MPENLELETRIAKGEQVPPEEVVRMGDPSPYACPECHGTLIEWAAARPHLDGTHGNVLAY